MINRQEGGNNADESDFKEIEGFLFHGINDNKHRPTINMVSAGSFEPQLLGNQSAKGAPGGMHILDKDGDDGMQNWNDNKFISISFPLHIGPLHFTPSTSGITKMKTQQLLIVSLAIAIGVAVASMMLANRKTQPLPASQPPATTAPAVVKPAPTVILPAIATKSEVQSPETTIPTKTTQQKLSAQATTPADASPPLTVNGYVVQDPAARAALSLVGADPDATQYWMGAINDLSMPPEERKDLIEDLNEDGLSDPQHPGVQDIPLIVNRIHLIEQLAPYATDPVNIDALAEAYKDLNNMLAGKPVQ